MDSDLDEERPENGNPHCDDYDSEGRCNNCGQFDCYECDWGYPFDDCKCYRCESRREVDEEAPKPKKSKKKPIIDEDLESMSKNELIAEAKKLRAGIRQHRDASGHNLCWYVPELWGLLPEKLEPKPEVPEMPDFIRNCAIYRLSLDKHGNKKV